MEQNPIFEAAVLTGRQQAFAMIASKCTYTQAVCLKEIHDTRAYEALGLNWEQFCTQHAGVGRVTAENIIRRVDEFGEAYFRLTALVRIPEDAYRKIADRVTAEAIELNGEQVPLTSENACKIRAGIQHLRDEVKRLNNYYRVPTRIVEYGIRTDDIIKAVTERALLARALPHDELAGLRSLTRRALERWSEVATLLQSSSEERGE